MEGQRGGKGGGRVKGEGGFTEGVGGWGAVGWGGGGGGVGGAGC